MGSYFEFINCTLQEISSEAVVLVVHRPVLYEHNYVEQEPPTY
jgi:hypothetical protein